MTIDGFRISATSNLGVSHIVSVIDPESARAVAKTLRVVENHMVWIEVSITRSQNFEVSR